MNIVMVLQMVNCRKIINTVNEQTNITLIQLSMKKRACTKHERRGKQYATKRRRRKMKVKEKRGGEKNIG